MRSHICDLNVIGLAVFYRPEIYFLWLCPNTFILPYPIAGYAPHMRHPASKPNRTQHHKDKSSNNTTAHLTERFSDISKRFFKTPSFMLLALSNQGINPMDSSKKPPKNVSLRATPEIKHESQFNFRPAINALFLRPFEVLNARHHIGVPARSGDSSV